MGLALFKERRISDRRRLTGLLPGRLAFAGKGGIEAGGSETSGSYIACRPVDVSANGMGIVASGQLGEIDPGTELVLVIKDRSAIRLQVAWSQPDFGKQDCFRYGLVTLDPAEDLEELFVSSGCMR